MYRHLEELSFLASQNERQKVACITRQDLPYKVYFLKTFEAVWKMKYGVGKWELFCS